MEKKEFRAESKKLLEMMINSVYTNKEIFLRELISNASDAIDKLYFQSLTDDKVGLNKEDFVIQIRVDNDKRTITISDNGIGMTKEELENNLGVIASSGSLKFKSENPDDCDVDIIGQFGVGFYSAFMVSKKVTVNSKAYGSDEAYKWESEGVDGYIIEPIKKDSVGTEIILLLKENPDDDDTYDQYLDTYLLELLIKKYSDYIRFPIKLEREISRPIVGDEDDYEAYYDDSNLETVVRNDVINSMVPIWKKNKSELTDEDYYKFYKEKFDSYGKPLSYVHSNNEGVVSYNALLYIPNRAEYNYYTKSYEKGLQLYSNGVLIMEKCPNLLSDHFSFVKGIIDTEDLSLNISREILQQSRALNIVSKNIEKLVKNELTKLLNNDREKYELFFKEFGRQLKVGIQSSSNFDVKESLKSLLLFYSLNQQKMITFGEYVSAMSDDQEYIFYATGETFAKIDLLPQADLIKDKGWDILCCTENIDEFSIKALTGYADREFKSISDNELELETPEEKEEIKVKYRENRELLKFMTNVLGGKITEVIVSSRLKKHPVCLTSKGEISIEMEKVMNYMANEREKVNAERVLEINPNHPVFETIRKAFADGDEDKLTKYTNLLYSQALLIEGLSVDNPVEFSDMICELMN